MTPLRTFEHTHKCQIVPSDTDAGVMGTPVRAKITQERLENQGHERLSRNELVRYNFAWQKLHKKQDEAYNQLVECNKSIEQEMKMRTSMLNRALTKERTEVQKLKTENRWLKMENQRLQMHNDEIFEVVHDDAVSRINAASDPLDDRLECPRCLRKFAVDRNSDFMTHVERCYENGT